MFKRGKNTVSVESRQLKIDNNEADVKLKRGTEKGSKLRRFSTRTYF